MKESVFLGGITEIYAAFGKSMPGMAIRNAIFKRLEDKPDAFMGYAMERICNLESLPANLGRYMEMELWPDFRETRPELADWSKRKGCPLCDPNVPGLRRVHSADYREIFLLKCPCNMDPKMASLPAWTDDLIYENGLHTEEEYRVWAKRQNFRRPAKPLESLGKEFKPREKHEEYLRQMEGALPW